MRSGPFKELSIIENRPTLRLRYPINHTTGLEFLAYVGDGKYTPDMPVSIGAVIKLLVYYIAKAGNQ